MFRGLLSAVLLAVVMILSGHSAARAADPSAAASPVASPFFVDPLDPRAGEGASNVGAPFLALVFVIGLGTAVVLSTVVFVKVTRRA